MIKARLAEQRRMLELAEQQRLADAARLAEEERLRRQVPCVSCFFACSVSQPLRPPPFFF